MAGTFLLLLTNRHLIVSREGRLLHRVHLHLAAPLPDLADAAWVPDARLQAIELAFTAPDGVRERFWLPIRGVGRVWHVDALFSHAFRGTRTINRYGPGRRPWPLTSPAPAH